jgi:LmbE family N-acetylglucosaminyl deacetylase
MRDTIMNSTVQPDTSFRILGVFAHPDDETFCAGGTLAKYIDQGAEVMVISATPGDAGQIRDANVATRRTLGSVRSQELQRACQHLGVQHVRCWGYGDGTLHDTESDLLIGDVVRAIREFRPHVVISFGPDGGYGHPDHIAVSNATTAAFQFAGDPKRYPGQGLPPHNPDRLYHAYFPQSELRLGEAIVKWLVSLPERFSGTLEFVHALLLLVEESTMLHYTSDHFDIKWFPAGFYIVEQGEPASDLFLILSGEADVIHEYEDGSQTLIATIGAGRFFGEDGIAHRRPRSAHVIARENLTCLVFAPSQPTAFAGRGEGARFVGTSSEQPGDDKELADQPHNIFIRDPGSATTCIDVREYVTHKINALAQHRTQYPIQPDMFPLDMLRDIMGYEYFVQVYPERSLQTGI